MIQQLSFLCQFMSQYDLWYNIDIVIKWINLRTEMLLK